MPPAPVDISVLVPVLNEAADIEETVRAMLDQRYPGTFELVIADGGSTDGTREKLAALAAGEPRIRVFDNPRRGTASGLNVCLREARGTYVARMDAHTFFPVDYLARGVARLKQGGTTWVAGPQRALGQGAVSRAVVASLDSPLGRGGGKRWGAGGVDAPEYELDTGVFCGVWRREDVVRHGGWDEGWPRNQDSEMAARFLRAGERIVCVPAMAADYLPRATIKSLFRQYRLYGVYRARTALRHPTSLRRSALLPPALVTTAAGAVVTPPPVRTLARAGVFAYLAAVFSATARIAVRGRARDALLVPVVLPTMHAAHGIGFFQGIRRWGVPTAAILRALGVSPHAGDGPYDGPVDAPSLSAERSV
jgi:glycosyltransferase involved in cell wall biosynthesis